MEIAADVTGGRKPLITLPRAVVRAVAPALDVFNAVWPGTPVFSGEQARLSAEFVYADVGRARQELGLPESSFRIGAERAYAWYQAHGYM